MHFYDVSEIKTKDIQAIIDSDPAGYYAKHDVKVLCNVMFKYAMEHDYITKNYTSFVRLPPIPKSKKDSFNEKELTAIWTDYNAGNQFTGYILLMTYTGMRFGELQAIKKTDIDLERRVIIGGIKTEAGKDREIPLCKKIMPIVQIFYE
jgi:integrase